MQRGGKEVGMQSLEVPSGGLQGQHAARRRGENGSALPERELCQAPNPPSGGAPLLSVPQVSRTLVSLIGGSCDLESESGLQTSAFALGLAVPMPFR